MGPEMETEMKMKMKMRVIRRAFEESRVYHMVLGWRSKRILSL